MRGGDGRLHAFDIPADAVLEVPIFHPDHDWLARLGLKWYAVPLICDIYLDAGGIRYPCAPFNGWYQASTEIDVRDLGDQDRYDMLPAVAKGLGLDISRLDTFWRDRAAVELAAAAIGLTWFAPSGPEDGLQQCVPLGRRQDDRPARQ